MFRAFSILLLIFSFSLAVVAQPDSPRRPPQDHGVRYDPGDNDKRLQLFFPETSGCPVVLYLYEGEEVPRQVGELFQRIGFGCGLVHPSDAADAAKALGFLKREVPALGGDPKRLFVIGEGQFGEMVATLAQSAELKGCLVMGLVLDLRRPAVPLQLLCGAADPDFEARAKELGFDTKALSEAPSRDLLVKDNSPVQKAVRRFLATYAPPPRVGLAGVKFLQSPNWDVRSLGGNIDVVVVHSTVIDTLEGTERAFLRDKGNRVSAHYVVDRDGTTVQMVDENFTAWHAGVSELEGRTGLNDFSVGIEIVNLNDGKDPYTDAQYEAVARIIRNLRGHWKIPDTRIVSHAQIARPVGRKSDPLGFDFQRLYDMLHK